MAFWGIEVKPGEPFTIKSENFDRSLMLTQATLGVGSSSQKSSLQVKVGDKEPIFVCTLLPEKSECFTLNLQFDEEDDVTFSVVGPTSIHLSGILDGPHDDEGDDDFDIYGEDMAETDSEDVEFDSEEDSDDGSDDESIDDEDAPIYLPSSARKSGVVIEEIEDEEKSVSQKTGNKQAKKEKEEPAALQLKSVDEVGLPGSTADKGKKKKKENVSKDDGKSAGNLKRKVDAMDQDQEPKSDAADAVEGDASEDNKKKNKKNKKKAKIEKDESAARSMQNAGEVASVKQDGSTKKAEKQIPKAVEETKQSKDKPAELKTYANGLIVEDLQPGKPNGRKASCGRKVSVRYIGKLKKGGKIFDSNTSGKPFKFKLGVGQVIKGWDVGVEGMLVGGKRRLTIPPSMGYGAEGAKPQIPPNAWLLFDVELVDVAR